MNPRRMIGAGARLLAPVCLVLPVAALPAAAAQPPAPQPVCTLTDNRIAELSGLASDGDRWYALNDGGERLEVFVLGRDCAVRRVITDSADPYDAEDLARGPDGTLWVSDAGDNRKGRETVALHALPVKNGAGNGKSKLYRLKYPDGEHDSEALLLDRAGTPYLITKSVTGDSGVYRPSGPLASPGPTPLVKVGTLRLSTTETRGGPVGTVGSMLVTGAAASADGSVVAVRTYTDAYLYPVRDGDVVAALTSAPVRVPLPDEPQGEAVAFEPDGTLLSASEGVGLPVRAVRGAAALAVPPTTERSPGGTGTSQSGGSASAAETERDSSAVLWGGLAVAAVIMVFLLARRRARR